MNERAVTKSGYMLEQLSILRYSFDFYFNLALFYIPGDSCHPGEGRGPGKPICIKRVTAPNRVGWSPGFRLSPERQG